MITEFKSFLIFILILQTTVKPKHHILAPRPHNLISQYFDIYIYNTCTCLTEPFFFFFFPACAPINPYRQPFSMQPKKSKIANLANWCPTLHCSWHCPSRWRFIEGGRFFFGCRIVNIFLRLACLFSR